MSIIKLKHLIKEQREFPIDIVQASQLASSKFLESIDHTKKLMRSKNPRHGPFYRAYGYKKEDYMMIDPVKNPRTSRPTNAASLFGGTAVGTNNFHTALIDLLPSWKDWPKRSKCVIFINSLGGTDLYGGYKYLVLPENGSKICVCSESDFWDSFPYMNSQIDLRISTLNKMIDTFFKKLKQYNLTDTFVSLIDITPEKLNSVFEKIQRIPKNTLVEVIHNLLTDNPHYKSFFYYFSNEYNGNFIDFFSKLMDPVKNDFKLVNLDKAYSYDIESKEMFTENTCMLINTQKWNNVV